MALLPQTETILNSTSPLKLYDDNYMNNLRTLTPSYILIGNVISSPLEVVEKSKVFLFLRLFDHWEKLWIPLPENFEIVSVSTIKTLKGHF